MSTPKEKSKLGEALAWIWTIAIFPFIPLIIAVVSAKMVLSGDRRGWLILGVWFAVYVSIGLRSKIRPF